MPSDDSAQAEAQSFAPMITGVTPSLRLRNGRPSTSSAFLVERARAALDGLADQLTQDGHL